MARGYKGKLIGSSEMILAFSGLYEKNLLAEQLDGILNMCPSPMWDNPSHWVKMTKDLAEKYHSGDELSRIMNSPNPYHCGVAGAQVMTEAIRRAAAKLGPEKVNSAAILDEIMKTDLTVDGFGNQWHFTKNFHCMENSHKAYRWSASEK